MNSRYFAVFASVVLVMVMMVAVPAFAGAQETSDSDTGYHAKGTNSNIYDLEYNFKHFSGPAGEGQAGILLATAGGSITGGEAPAEEKEGEMTVEQIAELMANPFSYLWFGMIQNDTYWWDGDLLDLVNEDKKVMNTTSIQPVMSVQLTEK